MVNNIRNYLKRGMALTLSAIIISNPLITVRASEEMEIGENTYILKEDNTFFKRLFGNSIEYEVDDMKEEGLRVFTVKNGKDKPIPLEEFLNWEEKYEYAVLSREEVVKIVEEDGSHYVEINPYRPSTEPIVLLLNNDRRVAIRYSDEYLKKNKYKGYNDNPFYNGFKRETKPIDKFAYIDSSGEKLIPIGNFTSQESFDAYYNTPYEEKTFIDKVLIALNLKEEVSEFDFEEDEEDDTSRLLAVGITTGLVENEGVEYKTNNPKKLGKRKSPTQEVELDEKEDKGLSVKRIKEEPEEIAEEKALKEDISFEEFEFITKKEGKVEIVKEEPAKNTKVEEKDNTSNKESEVVGNKPTEDSNEKKGSSKSNIVIKDNTENSHLAPQNNKPKDSEIRDKPVGNETIKDIYGSYDIKKHKPIEKPLQKMIEAFGLTDPVEFELLSERQLNQLLKSLEMEELEIVYMNVSKYNMMNKDQVEKVLKEVISGKSKEDLKDDLDSNYVESGQGEKLKEPGKPGDGGSITVIEDGDFDNNDQPISNTDNNHVNDQITITEDGNEGQDNDTTDSNDGFQGQIQIGDQNEGPLWNIGDYSGQENVQMGGEGDSGEGGVSWEDFNTGEWDKQVEEQGGSCYDLNLSTAEMNKCLVNGYKNYVEGNLKDNTNHEEVATGQFKEELETSQRREVDRKVADGLLQNYTPEQIKNMSDEEFRSLVEGSDLDRETVLTQDHSQVTNENVETGKGYGKLNNPYEEVYDESALLVGSEGDEDDLLVTAYTDMEYGLYDENFNQIEYDSWSFPPPEKKEIKFITYEIEEKKDYQVLTFTVFISSLIVLTVWVYIKAGQIQEEAQREEFKSSLKFETEDIQFMDIMDEDILGGNFK